MVKKILVMGVALIMCLGFFSGCVPKPKNICATAMFSKTVLELPIKGIAPNDPRIYDIELNMNEMFSIINADESLSARYTNKKIFISKDNSDETKDYFMIIDLTEDMEDDYYVFFGMQGWISFGINNRQLILMPYHLLDSPIYGWSLILDSNVEYKTSFSVDEFFDFYNDSGWYDMERGENYFIINGYIDDERVLSVENPNLGGYWQLEFKTPIKFQFKSSDESGVNLFVVAHVI